MFHYEPDFPRQAEPERRGEALLFFCVAVLWIVPGLFGHEPWKPDEAYNFGLVWHALQSGDWGLFHLADEQGIARAPLYYLTAATFGKLLSPIFALPDAVRLATGFYIALATLFVGLAGRELFGRGWMSALLLLGSFGLLARGHQIIPDAALLAGCAIALYGLAVFRKNIDLSGLLTGSGIGIAFLSKGLIALWLFLPAVLLLPLMNRDWRTLAALRALAMAAISALPWVAFWPHALFSRAPDLLQSWLHDGLRPRMDDPWFFLGILPWFAWPTLPLSLVALARNKTASLRKNELLLPLLVFCSMLAALSIFAPAREIHALPLLLPLALVATASLDLLKRNLIAAFNWFGIVTFGLMAGLFWLGWIAMTTGHPANIAAKIHRYHPDFVHQFGFAPLLAAAGATLFWLYLIAHRGQDARRAVVNWSMGLAMVWMILMTVWLPFIDSIKGYRETFAALDAALPARSGCIASRGLGEPQRAMLEYYSGITTRRLPKGGDIPGDCRLLIVQTIASDRRNPEGWDKLWEGSRPADRLERYRIYRRN